MARSLSLLPVLLFLIPIAWSVVVLFGLTMCRLGARSDRLQAVAVAEWIRTTYFAGSGVRRSDIRADQIPFDRVQDARRATG
jgi:hypothetical protein